MTASVGASISGPTGTKFGCALAIGNVNGDSNAGA
jgi:hypothetical protein